MDEKPTDFKSFSTMGLNRKYKHPLSALRNFARVEGIFFEVPKNKQTILS
jgi:hypothetical protein